MNQKASSRSAPVHAVGLIGQWRQGSFAVRSLAHVHAAVEASTGHHPGRRVASLVASVAGDAVLAERAGTGRRDRRLELAINTVDAMLWAWQVRAAPEFVRSTVVATVVPSALETGFRLGAGTDAVPVVEPPRRWSPVMAPPPATLVPRRWRRVAQKIDPAPHDRPRVQTGRVVEIVRELAVDVGLPLMAMAIVRRRRGQRLGWGPIGWVAFAAAGGYALARTRDDAQRSTVRLWQERTASVIEEARVASRVQSALVHNVAGVDPKAMLAELARGGSERAAQTLHELQQLPSATLRRYESQGTLLADATRMPIEPAEDASRWITNEEIRRLRTAIEHIDDTIGDADDGDADDETLTVVSSHGAELFLRYRGREIRLERAVPELAIRLEPSLSVAVVGAAWTLLCAFPDIGGIPGWAILPALGLQTVAVAHLAAQPGHLRRIDRRAAWLVAASVGALDIAVGHQQRRLVSPGGMHLVPATGATQPLTMLMAASWRDLGRERWPMAGLAALGWAYAVRRPGPRPWNVVIGELAFVLMPALATITTGADTRREADALDDALEQRLAADVDIAAREIAAVEVDRFVHQLLVVVDELEKPDYGQPAEVARVVVDRYRAEVERLSSRDPLDVVNW